MHKLRKHNIFVDGKRRRVRLLRVDKGSPFLVEVDDKAYEVELLNDLNYDTPVSIRVGGRPYRVELEEVRKSKPFSVKVNDKLFRVEYEAVSRTRPKAIEATLPATVSRPTAKLIADKGVVTASMPGRVVSLKVEVGDSVNEGDALCVLEAMKMENEIAAPVAGVVEEVMVSEGASVNRGDALVLIK
ncbi:MAG: biotin/lipoyl-containing protein [Candidatus Bathyarchaeia archaeon]